MTDHAMSTLFHANLTLPTTLTQIGVAAVMLLAGWPSRRAAGALLQRWGAVEPTELETDEALRYLERRRLAYPALYLAISLATSLLLPDPALILAVLLTGALLGEVIDWQRGRRAARPHSSTAPRSSTADPAPPLIPWWSLALAGMLLAAIVLLIGAGLLGQAWALQVIPAPGHALVVSSAAVLASATVICLAAHRPTGPTAGAHAPLRLRSARVGLALGMLALATVGASGGSPLGGVFAALSLVAAVATTAPVRCTRRPATTPPAIGSPGTCR
jgi:hypothetical protein